MRSTEPEATFQPHHSLFLVRSCQPARIACARVSNQGFGSAEVLDTDVGSGSLLVLQAHHPLCGEQMHPLEQRCVSDLPSALPAPVHHEGARPLFGVIFHCRFSQPVAPQGEDSRVVIALSLKYLMTRRQESSEPATERAAGSGTGLELITALTSRWRSPSPYESRSKDPSLARCACPCLDPILALSAVSIGPKMNRNVRSVLSCAPVPSSACFG